MADILIRKDRRAGRITFTRPQALNALNHDMALAINAALKTWQDDPEVPLVIIDAEGERAFCAGGDIAALYHAARAGDHQVGRMFFRDEYRMNARRTGGLRQWPWRWPTRSTRWRGSGRLMKSPRGQRTPLRCAGRRWGLFGWCWGMGHAVH